MNIWAALLLLVALLTAWLSRTWEPRVDTPPENAAEAADLVVQGFRAQTYAPSGEPLRRLEAVQLTHFPRGVTEMAAPNLILLQNSLPHWQVRADRATLDADGNHAWLLGDARLDQYNTQHTVTVRVDSRDVHVFFNESRAQTEAEVTITHYPRTLGAPAGVTRAKGMNAHLARQQVELLSQVHGLYQTEPE